VPLKDIVLLSDTDSLQSQEKEVLIKIQPDDLLSIIVSAEGS
jgi:hypothetical protein